MSAIPRRPYLTSDRFPGSLCCAVLCLFLGWPLATCHIREWVIKLLPAIQPTAHCALRVAHSANDVSTCIVLSIENSVYVLGRSQNCEKWLLASSVSVRLLSAWLSVWTHGKTSLLLDGFPWELIFEYFSKICRNSSFIKIEKEWWVLYMKTNIHFL